MRFAILARVSTEGQEKDGQSLEVQALTLRRCVEQLNGTLVKEYIGQESAMGTKARDIFTEMLVDCSQNLFDAVMVLDFSRISRNQNDTALFVSEFKKNNIKLYAQTQEYNLHNPESELQAGMFSIWNHFQVNLQTKKSMMSKIELARRGWAFTTFPHGRRPVHEDKSKSCEWEVIPEDKEQAERIYHLYVEDQMSLEQVADSLGLTKAHTRNILFKYSGALWTQTIKYEGRNEEIVIQVPSLLSDEQIERAKNRAKTNKQFNSRKYPYLLGGRLKCGVCKMTFVGMSANDRGKMRRYYTHSRHFRTEICLKNISVELVETATLRAISDLFSSTKNLRMAIENAIGVSNDRKGFLENKITEGQKTLERLEKEKFRLIQAVKKGLLEDADIGNEMGKIREDTIKTKEQLNEHTSQLQALMIDIPDDLHLRIQRHYQQLIGESGSIGDWEIDKQKRLLDWFFGIGKDQGVFVLKERSGLAFSVVGALGGALIGLVEDDRVSTSVIGIDRVEKHFQSEGVADFRRIIQEVDFYTRHGASASITA